MTFPRQKTPDGRGPDLFFAGGEAITRFGALVRYGSKPEDAAKETVTRNSDAEAWGRDGILRTWETDVPRAEWLSDLDLEATRNGEPFAADFRDASWFIARSTKVPLDDWRALFIREDTTVLNNHEVRQRDSNFGLVGGVKYVYSFEIKPTPSRTGFRAQIFENATSDGISLVHDFAEDVSQLTEKNAGGWLPSFKTTDVGGGWTRFHIAFTYPVAATSPTQITIGPAIGLTFTYDGDGVSGTNYRRPQIEKDPGDFLGTVFQATPRDTDRRFPSLLLEAQITNEVPDATDFDGAGWTQELGATVTPNTHTAPDGTLTASTLNDTSAIASASGISRVRRTIVVADNTALWTFSVYVKKGEPGDDENVVELRITLSGGITAVVMLVKLDQFTGEIFTGILGAGTGVEDAGDYWRLWGSLSNNLTGNITLQADIKPAPALTLTSGDDGAVLGSAVFWGAQLEQGLKPGPSSIILTTGAVLARDEDDFQAPFPHPPQEMTTYTKLVDGLGSHGARLWHIGNENTGDDPRCGCVYLQDSGGSYQFFHDNGFITGINSTVIVGTEPNDLIEALCHLYADGSVDITVARNGGEPIVGARSAVSFLAPAWREPKRWINSAGLTGVHNGRYLADKVQRGVRSLDFMRGL